MRAGKQPGIAACSPCYRWLTGWQVIAFCCGEEVVLPQHEADDKFFLHGDGWLRRWEVVNATQSGCLLRLRGWHPCGYDYTAQLCYQLEASSLHASLTLTHSGEQPMLYGCGFHPFLPLMRAVRRSFRPAATGRRGATPAVTPAARYPTSG